MEEPTLLNIMKESKMGSSNKELKRLFEQGAVSLDGEKVSDPYAKIASGTEVVLKAGKRKFLRILW